MLVTVDLLHHAQLIPPRERDALVSASVGPRDEMICLWASYGGRDRLMASSTQPGWARFPAARACSPATGVVTIHAPETRVAVVIEEIPIAHPKVQQLPDGRVLVVGARARWRQQGPDKNAMVFDADGNVVREATLGDGIEHVFATETGQVWVGYFDEGIFGNYGWNQAGAPAPIGSCGIARFSSELEPEWQLPSDAANEWGGVANCNALNVDGEIAWAYYYNDFPIVRIADGAVTGWRNSVSGADALVVAGDAVLLVGGYDSQRDRVVRARLDGPNVEVLHESRLTLPGGNELPAGRRMIGRGADLHVVVRDQWYRLSLPGT